MVPAFKIPKKFPWSIFCTSGEFSFMQSGFQTVWLSVSPGFSQSRFQSVWLSVNLGFRRSGFQTVQVSDGPGELQCCRNGMLSYAADCGVRLCPTVSDNAQILFPLYEEVGGAQFNLATLHVGKDLKALSGGGNCHVALAVDDIFKYYLC